MKHIFWKLQSINAEPTQELLALYRKKNKLDYKTGELMTMKEAEEHYSTYASRNPLFSKIHSLTVGYVANDEIKIKYFTGEEKDLIQTFLNTLNNSYFSEHKLTHLSADIILPYFGVRKDINKVSSPLPKDLKYKGLRPWDLSGTCLKSYFKGAGDYVYNLEELAYMAGFEAEGVIGHEFENDYHKAGRFDELRESAIKEVALMVNILRVEQGLEVLTTIVGSEEQVQTVEVVETINHLHDMTNNKNLTPGLQKFVANAMKGKRVTKKEKEHIKKILTALWVETDFITKFPDSKTTMLQKELEVNEFIDKL